MDGQKEVLIYSTPTCHFCQAAKAFFKENKIEYTDYNVAEDAEKRTEMVEKSGQMGVPVIFIGGEMTIGFDEGKVKELLGL
jgi:glutaredoxin 3